MASFGAIPQLNPVNNITRNLPPFTLWLYKLLAVFPLTGFTGIDHMAIGSQFTGFAKLFVNVLTLGSWYMYDIVQVYNNTNLRDKGLKIPFLESGSIGKGRIDDLPSKQLKRNEKNWLYLLFTLAFGLLYYISTFFLTTSTELFPTGLRYFSSFLLVITGCLGIFTAFTFSTTTSMNPFTQPVNTINPNQSLNNLYTQSGMVNPATTQIGSPQVSGLLNQITRGGGNDSLEGGELDGSINELRSAAASIMTGGSKQSYDHIYLGSLLLLLPISGFIVYNIKKKKLLKKE